MEYRLYFLQDDHFVGVVAFERDDDESAIAVATGQADGRAMELWQLDRLVKKFEPQPKRPSRQRA